VEPTSTLSKGVLIVIIFLLGMAYTTSGSGGFFAMLIGCLPLFVLYASIERNNKNK
jgi:uncharacterized membrane protein